VPEPQSHFQLSFTARQAMLLFVGLLLALGVAYFLGVMTGFSGSEHAAAVPTRVPTEEPAETPTAARAVASPEVRRTVTPGVAFPKPVLGTEPTSPPGLQLFEDRGGEEPTPAQRITPPTVVPSPAPGGDFWVQVLALSSEKEAKAAKERISRHGHHVVISQAPGPRGTVYRVRVGPFRSREQAAKTADQLSRDEKVHALVVPAGK
jgi:DedD protein